MDPKGICHYCCYDIIYFELRLFFTRCFLQDKPMGRGKRFYDGRGTIPPLLRKPVDVVGPLCLMPWSHHLKKYFSEDGHGLKLVGNHIVNLWLIIFFSLSNIYIYCFYILYQEKKGIWARVWSIVIEETKRIVWSHRLASTPLERARNATTSAHTHRSSRAIRGRFARQQRF